MVNFAVAAVGPAEGDAPGGPAEDTADDAAGTASDVVVGADNSLLRKREASIEACSCCYNTGFVVDC